MVLKYITDRQNRILEIIVSSYVNTAEPVGSRLVSKMMGFSSATIRNVMSDLEDLGYITHPHTSAGRVPTDKGYRCYVESLMRAKEITKKEASRIEEEYRLRRKSVDEIMKKTAEVLSSITDYTGVVLFSRSRGITFKNIDLVSVGRKKVLVVLVMSTGIVKNFIIDTAEDLEKDLDKINNVLNSACCGLTLDDVRERLLGQLRRERDSTHHFLKQSSEIIEAVLQIYYDTEVYLEGTSRLLSKPEFGDPKAARSILQLFENKNLLLELLEGDLGEDRATVHIGRENKYPTFQNYSIVTSGCRLNDELVGRLGVIGPTRMEYDHLIPLVNYISETVNRTLRYLVE